MHKGDAELPFLGENGQESLLCLNLELVADLKDVLTYSQER